MYLRDFLTLKPFHNYSLCSVCILPQSAFYSQSAVCILHSVCILPLVRSLRFTLTVKKLRNEGTSFVLQTARPSRGSDDHVKRLPKILGGLFRIKIR